MRYAKRYRQISLWTAVDAGMSQGSISRADFTYNFDGLTGSPNPGTQLTPATSIGASGQDNWFLSAGPTTPPVVRNDPQTGFSGNYLTSVVTPNGGNTSDTVVSTRLAPTSGWVPAGFATCSNSMAEVGPGLVNSSADRHRRVEAIWVGAWL